MILDAVLRQAGLFEVERLVGELKELGHRVSRATAYRTLSHLQDAGVLRQVFFDNKQSYYEVVAGRQTYDYLICVVTGRVIEFSSDKLRKLRDEICREHGFTPLSHQFHIFGVSAEGAVAERQKAEDAVRCKDLNGRGGSEGSNILIASTHGRECCQGQQRDLPFHMPKVWVVKKSHRGHSCPSNINKRAGLLEGNLNAVRP